MRPGIDFNTIEFEREIRVGACAFRRGSRHSSLDLGWSSGVTETRILKLSSDFSVESFTWRIDWIFGFYRHKTLSIVACC
jgi:hypothetical protein